MIRPPKDAPKFFLETLPRFDAKLCLSSSNFETYYGKIATFRIIPIRLRRENKEYQDLREIFI